MHSKPMITREQLAALRRRAERDSHEISLSATELLFGILFLVMGLLQVAGLDVQAIPVWLTLIGIALLLYTSRRLHRHYERRLGKVKPLTAGRPYDLIILMLFVALAVNAVTAVWLERPHPLLAEALRTSGFPFHFVLWMGLGLYLPLGVYLRIWRWVGATLWSILGFGALFVGLPALGIPRFVVLSFVIPGVGYTLSGLLFLRSERKRCENSQRVKGRYPVTEQEFKMDREQLAALSRQTRRDSYELLLSSLELPLGILLLTLGLLKATWPAVPQWLPTAGVFLTWYAAYRLYRHYQQQLGKVKPPMRVLVDLYMGIGFISLVVLPMWVFIWFQEAYPQLVEALRFWGFIPTNSPSLAITFFLPLGLYLRIWRWVGASLWIILGIAGLLLALPELSVDHFVLLGFLISGSGYATSGALFLRQVRRRIRELTTS